MDIEELDEEKLAELESMLYCQVFHSKETEDCQPTNTVPMEENANIKSNVPAAKPRYFEKQNKRPPKKNTERSWYAKNPEKTKQQQNNADSTSPIQNNITINHYVYNVPGWTHGNEKEDSLEILTSLKKKLSDKKRPHRKQRIKLKQKIAEKVREQRKKNRTHVIFISDDESSEGCEVIPEDSGNTDVINDSNSNTNSSNDEEVLFVPSKPCEVIELDSDNESTGNKESEQTAASDETDNQENVDAENNSNENHDQQGELDDGVQKLSNENSKAIKKVTSNENQESNDFLDAGVAQDSQDSFDFNLHGSEFNQCTGRAGGAPTSEQFVKPPNPSDEAPATENHETESESASSTTTGTDRVCSNEFSLKNIVFQEVDFPKADIFADNDLQGFEKLITPQRDDTGDVQGQRTTKEGRTPRSSKTGTPKAAHTPSPMTPASAKPRKRRSTAKSTRKRTIQQQGHEEKDESSEDSEESSSESDFESSKQPQQRGLPELSLMSQPNTPDRKQKRRESSNKDAGEGAQKQHDAKESRTPRTPKTGTPKAVHTPSPRTPVSGKAHKGGSSAKSAKKHVSRTEDKEKSGNSEKIGSENEFESSAGQRQNLPEQTQTKTPNREQKQQEVGNADEGEIVVDSPEVNETDNGVDEAVVDENPNETSVASKNTEVSSKGNDKYEKARNRKAQKAKKRQDTQKQISKKRKKSGRKSIRQASPPEQEEPVESPAEEQLPMESPPISVGDPSSNDGAVSDDDVVLIEKPIELIPVVDSDDEVEDILLGVEKPLEEPQDSCADDAQSNAVEKMTDDAACQAPIDLDLVYANLTNDPSKWQISRKDKPYYVALEQRQKTKGPRCNRCRRFGHTALKCTEKSEPPRCYLCGEGDHAEPRCPNKICLNCGNKGDYTTNYCYRCFKYRDLQCRLCSQPGHLSSGCPDLWRRYHMTTEPGPIKVPSGPQLKPRQNQWCSGCASQGHLEHECYYYGRQYPPSLPYIVNYDDVLFPDDPQQPVVLPKDTPEKSTNSDATPNRDTPSKRAQKHKTPNERSEQFGNSAKDIAHTPQKRTKCLNEAQMVTGVTVQPEDAARSRDLPIEGSAVANPVASLGAPVQTLPQSRLFNLAGYRLQPRVDPEMRLFNIAGYGIPPATVNEVRPNGYGIPPATVNEVRPNVHGIPPASVNEVRPNGHGIPPAVVNEVRPNHNVLSAPAGIWPPRELMTVNENVHVPPVPAVTAPPSLLSLKFPPDFALGGFDRLPTGEELRGLENRNHEAEQEMDHQGGNGIEYRLGPLHNRKMKEYFLTAPVANLKAFVSSELKNLSKIRKTNIEHRKKQVTLAMRQQRAMKRNKNPSAKEMRKEIHRKDVYRRTNMLLFGVHQLLYGQRHFATLKRLSKVKGNAERDIPRRQRMAFYIAYDYIFGEELKHGVNYPDLLEKLFVRKQKKKAKLQQRLDKQLARAQHHQMALMQRPHSLYHFLNSSQRKE